MYTKWYMKALTLALVALGCVGCGGGPGAAGPTGATGAAGHIIHTTSCNNSLSSDSGTSVPLFYRFDFVTLSSGDVQVACSVAGSSQEGSNAVFYASTMPGASSGACFIDSASGAPGTGYWTLSLQGATAKAVYSAPGQAHDGYTYTFSSAQCFID